MSHSPLVNAIADRLRRAGYVDLVTPFRVASVNFDFTAAFRGSDGRSLDLVLLVDTTTGDFGDRDAVRVRQRVEALSRALDVTGSRFVITVILAGAALVDNIESLTETCRVLNVEAVNLETEGSFDQASTMKIEDRIRVLLPLELPNNALEGDGEGSPVEQMIQALSDGGDSELLKAVMTASQESEEAVTTAMSAVLASALLARDEK